MKKSILIMMITAVILLAGCAQSDNGKQTPTAAESIAPTTEPTLVQETEATEEPAFSITQEEIEAEIEAIRTYYYTPGDADTKKVIEKGTNDWGYARDYRYHDGKLIFAFVFDGTEEHRLYFKDDHMIRYIDENGTVYDYPDSEAYHEWAEKVLAEAYPAPDAETEQTDSSWIGTWKASSGESLEITSQTDQGLKLIFHKLSEQGNMMDVNYEMEFDNDDKTIASEIGGPEDHGNWEYTFVLGDGVITVKSRYPDQLYYKE